MIIHDFYLIWRIVTPNGFGASPTGEFRMNPIKNIFRALIFE